MNFFYRVVKSKRRYSLEFRLVLDSGFENTYSIPVDSFLSSHNIHSTGLDFYGCTSTSRVSGFSSVSAYSDWTSLNFIGHDNDYFYIDFPTNFGYISPRFKFLRSGNFHLRVNFRFSVFRDSILPF